MEFNYAKNTLIDLLEYRALNQRDKTAFIYLESDDQVESKLTYGGLMHYARNIAYQLADMAPYGERVLLLFPPGLEFIKAFFGCLYANLIAVPAYPPRNNRNTKRIYAIFTDASVKLCLSTSAIQPKLQSIFTLIPDLEKTAWLFTDKAVSSCDHQWKRLPKPEDLAILQYTSGSTSLPKGVMVSHKNFMHNLSFSFGRWELSEDSKFVSWLPVYHDMGLVSGILLPIFGGFSGILMSPTAFLQRPFRWLNTISDYNATISIAPNFAYDLCVDKVTGDEQKGLDLSNWRHAINGAEPVNFETMERFVSAFESCGFKKNAFNPGYGLAEGTLVVSVGWQAANYRKKEVDKEELGKNKIRERDGPGKYISMIVGCGRGAHDQQIAIVNPETLGRCLPGEVGEVWLKGPSVAQGYWNKDEETSEIFQAYLTDTGEGPFLRTGDLGFLDEEELFITGRLKDIIIIHGINHYPQEIELAVIQCDDRFRKGGGAAFSVTRESSERLVVVQEIESHAKFDKSFLINTVRNTIAESLGIHLYALLLVKSHSVPKTSSGKIQRKACRSSFEKGELKIVSEWREDESSSSSTLDVKAQFGQSTKRKGPLSKVDNIDLLRSWLVTHLSNLLNIAPTELNPAKPLSSFGLDSVQSVTLVGDLERETEHSLPASLIFDYPSIDAICGYFLNDQSPKISSPYKGNILTSEPIAVIGMACRFPAANNLEEFWELLRNGTDAIIEAPENRWDDNPFDKFNDDPDRNFLKQGGFIQGVDMFDHNFFEVSVREAKSMDPQQRILLETVWEALENAGQSPTHFYGSQTGVFIGISSFDHVLLEFEDPKTIDAYGGTGIAHSISANRISYYFNLSGPSMAVDTACSSSLVSLHLACQSLRQGESNMTLTGGVNLILSPLLTQSLYKAGMLAIDGRCKSFDQKADGYVRGEGCGIVVLKRLSDAEANRDQILAVIKGSAVGQDGRSNGLTAPNGPSQEGVIQKALEQARVQPNQIGYVECHGTGTPLGDPQEVLALQNVLGTDRTESQKFVIGSVKANIGHLEAAAGIAGFIKGVLILKHNLIPPQVHFRQINPHIPIAGCHFTIPENTIEWLKTEKARFIGVSSFGFGGTNSHVVISDPPKISVKSSTGERPWHVLTLSAKSDDELKQLSSQYLNFSQSLPPDSMPDMCFTANTGRRHFSHRLAIPIKSHEQMMDKLEAINSEHTYPEIHLGKTHSTDSLKLIFIFPGQGAQFPGMGKALYKTQPVFRETVDHCASVLDSLLEFPLLSVLYPESTDQCNLIHQINYAHPILFTMEYALAELLKSWGVVPNAVMGHSTGEYVAACIAGIFSLEDGLMLISERARLINTITTKGKMISIFASKARVIQMIKDYPNSVSIAEANSPFSTVISGEAPSIDAILEQIRKEKIPYRDLKVSQAVNSHLIDPILDEFEGIAETIQYSHQNIPIISTLTGAWMEDSTVINANYWKEHARKCIQFSQGILTCIESGYTRFLEVGPGPNLINLVKNCAPDVQKKHENMLLLRTLERDVDEWRTLLNSIAKLHVSGYSIDWEGFDQGYSRKRINLPTYTFSRKHFPLIRTLKKRRGHSRKVQIFDLLVNSGHKEAEAGFEHYGLKRYHQLCQDLNRISVAYQCHALASLGIFGENEEGIGVDQMIKKADILPRHQKLMARWLENLYNKNVLNQQNYMYKPEELFKTRQEECSDIESIMKEYQNTDLSVFGDYVKLFGENLEELLTGNVDPLELLFPAGSFDMAKRLYQLSSPARYYNGIIAKIVKTFIYTLAKKVSSPIKILEIGAGTGATTSSLISICPPKTTRYHFTDISDLFINRAKVQFSDYTHMKYDILNIEDDPASQGIKPADYDVVIASNAIHATRNLDEAIKNVCKILAPEGVLILWELTEQLSWFDTTFGLIDGWQRFNDHDLRGNHPLLNSEGWFQLLRAHGLTRVSAFPDIKSVNVDLGQYIIVAQGDAVKSEAKQESLIPLQTTVLEGKELVNDSHLRDELLYEVKWIPKDLPESRNRENTEAKLWIIFADRTGLSEELIQLIESEGDRSVCLYLGELSQPQGEKCIYLNPNSLEQDIGKNLSNILVTKPKRVEILHCWSLDCETSGKTDLDSVESLLKYGCEFIIQLLRFITSNGTLRESIRFWIMTRSAQDVTGDQDDISVASAALWGLGRGIAVEYPCLKGGLVDLAPTASENEANSLFKELQNSDGEDQVAYREDKRLVPRLHRHTLVEKGDNNISCQPDGTYVISGGLGGLGLMAARWLVEKGARRLLLLGQNDLPPRREWERFIGGHITIL